MRISPDIESCARSLLDLAPDPVPRFLILRDILKQPTTDRALKDAKQAMLTSRWVSELAAEQLEHGGWARFHSMDTKSDNKIFTTEYGVQRVVHLGLEAEDAVLTRARRYLIALLSNQFPWPEHKEANDRWAIGEKMFVASTLAWIDPVNPVLENVYAKWCAIAEQTFASGRYDPEAEARAHRLSASGSNCVGYLGLRNRYAVHLLAKVQDRLPDRTESAYLEWLWHQPRGLGYVDVPLSCDLCSSSRWGFDGWFFSQRLLSGFRSWHRRYADGVAVKLWSLRNGDGLWDFGPRANGIGFRLSESWRKRTNRLVDHSVVTLLLLAACHAK